MHLDHYYGLILMAEEKKDDKGEETENQLRRELEELKKEVKRLKEEKAGAPRSELLKETSKVLRRLDVGGFGILAGLIDGIGNLAELADKIQDPKNPLHNKLKVEYAIKTSGLLGDRYIASGRAFAGRQESRAPEPLARPEERKAIMEEIRELRKLKEQFLKAQREAEKEKQQ